MPALASAHPVADDPRKLIEALQRAVTISRMVDYGVPVGDALSVHAETRTEDPPSWSDVCERIANRHARIAREAEAAGCNLTARQAWRASAALLLCGQLAFNFDVPQKRVLYDRAREALLRYAALDGQFLDGKFSELVIPTNEGDLYGWVVRPSGSIAKQAVIVLGGLSGWGPAFINMGHALAKRGILAILAEGPGQGLSRMRSGIVMGANAFDHLSAFLDYAVADSERRLGVWGNSFGGLLAAQLALRDLRVEAACVNGAPRVLTVPPQRTAREQMYAFFGIEDERELTARLEMLAVNPERQRFRGSMLVVEGGADPLVPMGEQASFLSLAPPGKSRLLSWPDGEHTVYNHAEERSALVSDWFAEQLRA